MTDALASAAALALCCALSVSAAVAEPSPVIGRQDDAFQQAVATQQGHPWSFTTTFATLSGCERDRGRLLGLPLTQQEMEKNAQILAGAVAKAAKGQEVTATLLDGSARKDTLPLGVGDCAQ